MADDRAVAEYIDRLERKLKMARADQDRLRAERTPLIEALQIIALPGELGHEPCREIARIALAVALDASEEAT